jgi:hypothetical protein
LKTPFTKKSWWSGSRLGPEFKPQYHKKKERERNNTAWAWWAVSAIPVLGN